MSTTEFDDGGPAFAAAGLAGLPNGDFIYGQTGMSLRQHYAGKAMAALVAQGFDIEQTPPLAFETADAMIRAGHNPPQQIEKPFDPATLTNDERAAMDRLTGWLYFDDLPVDLKARATATAQFLKSDVADDGIPF